MHILRVWCVGFSVMNESEREVEVRTRRYARLTLLYSWRGQRHAHHGCDLIVWVGPGSYCGRTRPLISGDTCNTGLAGVSVCTPLDLIQYTPQIKEPLIEYVLLFVMRKFICIE